MTYHISPVFQDDQLDTNGKPASGWLIYWFRNGTTDLVPIYRDKNGSSQHTNPIVLNSRGSPGYPIWLDDDVVYRAELRKPDGVTTIASFPDIVGIGVQGVVDIPDGFISVGQVTVLTNTSFSVVGDQRNAFCVGRRIRYIIGGTEYYGTVEQSSYSSPNTTVVFSPDNGVGLTGAAEVSYVYMPSQAFIGWTKPNDNIIKNSDFRVTQADLQYGEWSNGMYCDGWIVRGIGGLIDASVVQFSGPTSDCYLHSTALPEYATYATNQIGNPNDTTEFGYVGFISYTLKQTLNQVVTISFLAKGSSGKRVAINLKADPGYLGSGGVATYLGTVTLTNSWKLYVLHGKTPDWSGAAIGGNPPSLVVEFILSAGSYWNSRTGSLGLQDIDFYLTQPKLEFGPSKTLHVCERGMETLVWAQQFYQKSEGYGEWLSGYGIEHVILPPTVGVSAGATAPTQRIKFHRTMPFVPSVYLYSPATLTPGAHLYGVTGPWNGGDGTHPFAACEVTTEGFRIYNSGSSRTTSYVGGIRWFWHATAWKWLGELM